MARSASRCVPITFRMNRVEHSQFRRHRLGGPIRHDRVDPKQLERAQMSRHRQSSAALPQTVTRNKRRADWCALRTDLRIRRPHRTVAADASPVERGHSPATSMPTAAPTKNDTACRSGRVSSTRLGPGQMPLKPQPTPKIALPMIRRRSILRRSAVDDEAEQGLFSTVREQIRRGCHRDRRGHGVDQGRLPVSGDIQKGPVRCWGWSCPTAATAAKQESGGERAEKLHGRPSRFTQKTVTMAMPIKVNVATRERGDRLAIPHTP